jgi:hypothetical protein
MDIARAVIPPPPLTDQQIVDQAAMDLIKALQVASIP